METARLRIRPLESGDGSAFVEGIASRSLRAAYGFPEEMDASVPPRIFRRFLSLGGSFALEEKSTGKMIGFLLDVEPELPEDVLSGLPEKGRTLAYAVFPPHQRQGYMREALQACIPSLFRAGAEYVHCGRFPENVPCGELLRGLRFREYARHTLGGRAVVDEVLFRPEAGTQNKESGEKEMLQDNTLDWYSVNAETFIAGSEGVDMSAQYRPFLALVAPGGRILDLGSGAGNASLYFTRAGYRVLASDGCPELLEHTRKRVGCEVRCLRFEDLDYTDAFDGVWACASLLHVPKAGLPGIFRLVRRALKTGGVFYASFKYGDTERVKNGRSFTDLTEDSLRSLLEEAGGFRITELWVTADVRPDRASEHWVNVLCFAE